VLDAHEVVDPELASEGHLHQEDDSSWAEVGQKNRKANVRSAAITETALSELVFGRLRSVVRGSTARGSASIEPFVTLPVDITVRMDMRCRLVSDDRTYCAQHNEVELAKALEAMAEEERLDDMRSNATGRRVCVGWHAARVGMLTRMRS
jgi:hypothetical protein